MPLLDHFHPPIFEDFPPDTLHSSWASEIARRLNTHWLRQPFRALEHTHSGSPLEIDVAVQEREGGARIREGNGPVATLPAIWAPPVARAAAPLVLPASYEVRVFDGPGGWRMVGAVELVSRSNKSSPEERQAFASKCAAYLHAGVSVVIVDIVTDWHANLHNALLDRLGVADPRLPDGVFLYASAYRPARRSKRPEVDIWCEQCALGADLPTMPLRLTGDLFVPIELEHTYMEARRAHQVP